MSLLKSLRWKLVATFVAGSLVTVVLFSVVIKALIRDHFTRESEVRSQFVEQQGRITIQTNFAVFKNNFQQYWETVTTALSPLCESGFLGNRLPSTQKEREALASTLRGILGQTALSMITVVDSAGRAVVRATNPAAHGDAVLFRDYESPRGPVSSTRQIIQSALNGRAIRSFEALAPEVLESERYVDGTRTTDVSLKDRTRIGLLSSRSVEVPPGQFEDRALGLVVALPVKNSNQQVVGVAVAVRLINKEFSFVRDVQQLLQDQATIILGRTRVVTTLSITTGENEGRNAIGTLLPETNYQRVIERGEYVEGPMTVGEERMIGAYDPIRNSQNTVIGALWIGRSQAYFDSIVREQEAIEAAVENRTTLYIVVLGLVSFVGSFIVASVLSARINARIDALRRGAAVIEDGNLHYRLNIKSGDEIETLGNQFNSMAAKLEESYQTLERKVEERTAQLRQSQATLVQQEKMVGIGQLAAGIAHEMNTPLSTIIGYAQMLREDLGEAKPSVNLADVDEIIEQAGRCRDLVKNLLNFSRRSGESRKETDVNAIVRKTLSLVGHDFEMRRIRLRLNLNPQIPRIKVNENEIAQVLLNLANNAADSMPDGGELHVSTHHDPAADRIDVLVRDSGCGIREMDRNRVFEPFFTTKDVGKGTGLGLSICYQIVENHGGVIDFDSEVGRGTTFRVGLPVHSEVQVG